jgi:hypothetical protein
MSTLYQFKQMKALLFHATQPLTERSTRNLPGSKGRPARRADNLTAICEPIVQKMWESRHLTTLWAFAACYRDRFTFTSVYCCNTLNATARLKDFIPSFKLKIILQKVWRLF